MITYIEFHKKISATCVSQYVYTSTTVESLSKFVIKVNFLLLSQVLFFQNCKYLFSIFLINSGIVLALMGSVVSALSHAVSRRNDFSSKMYDFRCSKASSFDIINDCFTIVFSSLLQRYE